MINSTTMNSQTIEHDIKYDHHFETEHLKNDLKKRSVRGGLAILFGQVLKFVMQLGSTMVLARLLTPTDFGLVAMVFAVTGFVSMFKDAGLSMATIQQAKISHAQISMLFWINLGISVFLMLVTAALAPLIVWFYKEPKLAWITVATAGTFIFGGLTIQHQALMRRQMRFDALSIIEVVSMAVGIVAAVILAIFTRSYWSLVLMPAAASASNTLMVWLFCDWRPCLPRRNTGVRPMLKFGVNMMAGTVLWYLNRNLYNIMIGRVLGPQLLGFFSKAQNLTIFMLKKVNSPLYSVSFPALSALQNQQQKFREYYKKAIGTMALITMPAATFLIAASEHIVQVMLGKQWIACIPIFRALGPAAFLGTISLAIACVIIPLGKPEREWKLKAVATVLHFAAILIGIKWGITGVALALSFVEIVYFLPSHIYAFRNTPIRLSDLFEATWHAAVSSLFSGMLVWLIAQRLLSPSQNVYFMFTCLIGIFAASYLGIFLIIPGGSVKVKGFVNLIRSFKKTDC